MEIFYHGMESEHSDFSAIRKSIISLMTSADSEYRHALLLGNPEVKTPNRERLGVNWWWS